MEDVFKTNDADRAKEKKQLEDQIDKLNLRFATLHDKYVDGFIDDPTYQENKKRYERDRNELISNHSLLKPEGTALKEYIRFSALCSSNLGNFYKRADFEGKQQIIGSIFPDKLLFEEKKYRTNAVNEAIQLMCSIDKALYGSENKKVGKIADLSTLAPPTTPLSNLFLRDLDKIVHLQNGIKQTYGTAS